MNNKKIHGAKLIYNAKFKFVANIDGISIGVTEDGLPFDSGNDKWAIEDKIRWAALNAAYFEKIAQSVNLFKEALMRQKDELQRS